jgi:hypothetical protein
LWQYFAWWRKTFSANGKTLVGDTYHLSYVSEFENGVRAAFHGNGVEERVHLPDGGIFIVPVACTFWRLEVGSSSQLIRVTRGTISQRSAQRSVDARLW